MCAAQQNNVATCRLPPQRFPRSSFGFAIPRGSPHSPPPLFEARTNPRGHSRQPIIASRERTVAIRDLVFCSIFLLFSLPPHHHHTTIGLLTHCWPFIVVLGCFVLYCSFILGGFCLLVLLFSQKKYLCFMQTWPHRWTQSFHLHILTRRK